MIRAEIEISENVKVEIIKIYWNTRIIKYSRTKEITFYKRCYILPKLEYF